MVAEPVGNPFLSRREETPAERDARLRQEAEVIARGHAAIDAGLGIEQDALKAWLLALDEDENTPLHMRGEPLPRP